LSNITLILDEFDVLSNFNCGQIVRHFGTELLDEFRFSDLIEAAGGVDEIIETVSDEGIDREFLNRHPNPSEILDYLDDEAIIDYLLNKGYNIEM